MLAPPSATYDQSVAGWSSSTMGVSMLKSAKRQADVHVRQVTTVPRESGMSSFSQTGVVTPMVAGSQPADYTNEASTTQTTSDKKSSGPPGHSGPSTISGHATPEHTQTRPFWIGKMCRASSFGLNMRGYETCTLPSACHASSPFFLIIEYDFLELLFRLLMK